MLVLVEDCSKRVMHELCSNLSKCISLNRFDDAIHYIRILECFVLDNTTYKECDCCEEKDE